MKCFTVITAPNSFEVYEGITLAETTNPLDRKTGLLGTFCSIGDGRTLYPPEIKLWRSMNHPLKVEARLVISDAGVFKPLDNGYPILIKPAEGDDGTTALIYWLPFDWDDCINFNPINGAIFFDEAKSHGPWEILVGLQNAVVTDTSPKVVMHYKYYPTVELFVENGKPQIRRV